MPRYLVELDEHLIAQGTVVDPGWMRLRLIYLGGGEPFMIYGRDEITKLRDLCTCMLNSPEGADTHAA